GVVCLAIDLLARSAGNVPPIGSRRLCRARDSVPQEVPMDINEDDILNFLHNVKLSEVRGLVDRLERSLGVSADPPVRDAWPPPPPEPDVAPTAFDVVLQEVGEKRLNVIRVLRQRLSLGVREARDLATQLPATVAPSVDAETAEDWARELRAAGAVCEVRPA
ncbi:MAG: ribosomal protein L7/L12, partial [Myxococcota bacterium]